MIILNDVNNYFIRKFLLNIFKILYIYITNIVYLTIIIYEIYTLIERKYVRYQLLNNHIQISKKYSVILIYTNQCTFKIFIIIFA